MPFIIINIYNNFLSKNNNLNVTQYDLIIEEKFFNFKSNRLIYTTHVNDFTSNNKCEIVNNNKLFKFTDKYSSGRVCGWEILIKDFKKKTYYLEMVFFMIKYFLKNTKNYHQIHI